MLCFYTKWTWPARIRFWDSDLFGTFQIHPDLISDCVPLAWVRTGNTFFSEGRYCCFLPFEVPLKKSQSEELPCKSKPTNETCIPWSLINNTRKVTVCIRLKPVCLLSAIAHLTVFCTLDYHQCLVGQFWFSNVSLTKITASWEWRAWLLKHRQRRHNFALRFSYMKCWRTYPEQPSLLPQFLKREELLCLLKNICLASSAVCAH